jgi:lysine-specific demethylase 8
MRRKVRRISRQEWNDGWRGIVREQQPVIIEGLMANEPLAKLDSVEKVEAAFGGMDVRVSQEYITLAERIAKAVASGNTEAAAIEYDFEVEHWPLSRYLKLLREDPGSTMQVIEAHPSKEFMAQFAMPAMCGKPEDVITEMFVSAGGNATSLHFDIDCRQVLTHHVFGRKRYVFLDPIDGRKINPLFNHSTLVPKRLSPADREAFLDYANASECVLEAGDGLFMPALIWHDVEYLEQSMSFGLRFHTGNKRLEFFGKNVHSDFFMQNVGWAFGDEHRAERYAAEFAAIEAACRTKYASEDEKYWGVRRVLREVYERICVPSGAPEYFARGFAGTEALESQAFGLYRSNYSKNFATGILD